MTDGIPNNSREAGLQATEDQPLLSCILTARAFPVRGSPGHAARNGDMYADLA